MADNPYDVLGVSPNATPDEVKKAYRKKARENHPDLNPNDPKAAERMNQINEAYDRIMNPEKYAARDRRAQSSQGGGASSGGTGTGGYGGGTSGYGGGRTGGYGYGNPFAGGQGQGGQRGSTQGNPYGTEGPYGWTGFGFDFDDLFGFGGTGASNEPIHPEASASDSAEVRAAIDAINAGRFRDAVVTLNRVVSTYRDARWYYLSAIANNGAGNSLMALEQIRRAVQMDPTNRDYQRAQQQFQQAGQTYRQESETRGFNVGIIDPMTLCCFAWCFAPALCRLCVPH